MKPCDRPVPSDDWAAVRLRPVAPLRNAEPGDRRGPTDRRLRIWWAVLYGNFNPRRRRPPRRLDESRFHSLDWHSSHLLAVAIGILLLSGADAFMTLVLLSRGAVELNPVMALVVERSPALFASVKLTMTGLSVIVMVTLARYRFMRLVRVDAVMYVVLVCYAWLLSYEFWLLRGLLDPASR